MSKEKVGRKYDADKPRWSFLPWEELEEAVLVLNFGAKKYGENNWQKVKNGERRYQDAALRHMKAVMTGEQNDSETGRHHYAHAICSLLFCLWFNNQRKTKHARMVR